MRIIISSLAISFIALNINACDDAEDMASPRDERIDTFHDRLKIAVGEGAPWSEIKALFSSAGASEPLFAWVGDAWCDGDGDSETCCHQTKKTLHCCTNNTYANAYSCSEYASPAEDADEY